MQLGDAAHCAFVMFKNTIRAFLSVQASSASSERLFSAAKLVTPSSNAVVMRSYLQQRVTDEVTFDAVVKKITSAVAAAREQANK